MDQPTKPPTSSRLTWKEAGVVIFFLLGLIAVVLICSALGIPISAGYG